MKSIHFKVLENLNNNIDALVRALLKKKRNFIIVSSMN